MKYSQQAQHLQQAQHSQQAQHAQYSQHTQHSPKRILSLILSLLLLYSLLYSCALPALAAGETASVMKIIKTVGTVSITGSKGKKIPLIANMNLYDGYGVATGGASYAWISLDSAKLAMLDEVSGASVYKQGKKLEIMLDSGALFFNVEKPLEDDESFTIRTSTMAVGIRGTSGWVRVFNKNLAQIYVLEGTVEVFVRDPVSGQMKTEKISGGDTAIGVVYEQTRVGDKCDILRAKYNEDKVPGFVLSEVATHPGYAERIFEKSAEYVDLRKLTLKEAGERLSADQADTARKLEQAQRKQNAQHSQTAASSDNGTDTNTSMNNSSTSSSQPNTDTDTDTLETPGTDTDTPETPGTDTDTDTPETPGTDTDTDTPEVPDTVYTGNDDNFSYTYSTKKKTLTISKKTANSVLSYDEVGAQPWAEHLDDMERVVIASGITKIGNNAFLQAATRARAAGGAPNLRNVTLPVSLTSIEADAFAGCPSIETVYFGGDKDTWSRRLPSFAGLNPAGKQIYYSAGNATTYYYYDDAVGKETLIIAGDGDMAYYGAYSNRPWHGYCDKIENVEVKEGVTSIGEYAFVECTKLTRVTLPKSVTDIGRGSFRYCSSLTEITLPSRVTGIGEYAFSNCGSLTSITIPNSVTSIGQGAFDGSGKLAEVRFDGTQTEWNNKGWDTIFAGKTITILRPDDQGTPVAQTEEGEKSALSDNDVEKANEKVTAATDADKTGEDTNTATDAENTGEEANTETTPENTGGEMTAESESGTDEASQEVKQSEESEASQESDESASDD